MTAAEALRHVSESPRLRGVHDRDGNAHWIPPHGDPVTLAQAKPFAEHLAPYSAFPLGKGLTFKGGGN